MSRAFPPVGWHKTVEQPAQTTTVWACENTVVIVKQPGHLTSIKNERGAGTRVYCRRSVLLLANVMAHFMYLKLVLSGLCLRRRIKEIDCEHLRLI